MLSKFGSPEHDGRMLDDRRARLAHEVHVLINQRQQACPREAWEHWLYEAKGFMQEYQRLVHLYKAQRQQRLPTTMHYCSHSPVEQLDGPNELICALGEKVHTCPILADVLKPLEGQFPTNLLDEMAAQICVGHLLQMGASSPHPHISTIVGYVSDASDRLYWQRYMESMSQSDEEDSEPTDDALAQHSPPTPTGED